MVCVEECRLETLLEASRDVSDVDRSDSSQSTRHAEPTHKPLTAWWLAVFKVNNTTAAYIQKS